DGVTGGLGLGAADVRLAVDDLALQVRLVDLVELHDAERADARGGQVHQRRRAQAAGSHTEHLGGLQPLLPGHPDVGDDQVAGVPADLVYGELGSRLDQGWQRHGDSVGRSITTFVLAVTLPWASSFRDTCSDPRDDFVPVAGHGLPGVGAAALVGAVREVDRRRALPAGDAQRLVEVASGHAVHAV